MPSLVAVDLAARYSGAVWLDEAGRAVASWSSFMLTEDQFITEVTSPFRNGWTPLSPDILLIEDVPHGLKFMRNVKQVVRTQGRIIDRMCAVGMADRIVFYPPDLWQRPMGVWKQGMAAVVPRAAELGYEPPDLTEGLRAKATARKCMTDFCAAFLMGRQAQRFHVEQGTVDVHPSSRYSTWLV